MQLNGIDYFEVDDVVVRADAALQVVAQAADVAVHSRQVVRTGDALLRHLEAVRPDVFQRQLHCLEEADGDHLLYLELRHGCATAIGNDPHPS